MGTNSPNHNSSNLAFISSLRANGAKTVFKLTIPNHRIAEHKRDECSSPLGESKKIKDREKAVFDSALLSTATGRDS